MIAKIICWIFGHKRTFHSFIKYLDEYDMFGRRINLVEIAHFKTCPRCGANL